MKKEKADLELQAGKRQAPWQIVHRVFHGARRIDAYLDEPRWLEGDLGKTSLQGNLAVANIDALLLRTPNFVFVVFKNYKGVRDAGSLRALLLNKQG